MENLIEKAGELVALYGIKVISAIIIFIIGRWIAKLLSKLTKKMMDKGKVDPTLTAFVGNATYIVLLVFVVLAAIGKLGVQTTSFIAVLGAAGLAIGLALQGSLANFAAGFLMILFRPFKVGDFIEGAGVNGIVEEIQIFTTQLRTPDNKTVIIPNARLTEDNIINFSSKGTRRMDLVFGIGYGDDIDKTKAIIEEVIDQDERILKDPPKTIGVLELGDSSVNIAMRPWVKVEDYWNIYFDLIEKVKKKFDTNGITIPFPQRDVHIYEHKV